MNVVWGFTAVVVLKKIWNQLSIEENRDQVDRGRPQEMYYTDPTDMGKPVYHSVGPFAIKG